MVGKIDSEIEVYNGGNVLLSTPYRLYFCNNLSLTNRNLKLTIRQQNGIASFFLNEQFLYQVDALVDTNLLVGAIQSNDNLNVEYFSLSSL